MEMGIDVTDWKRYSEEYDKLGGRNKKCATAAAITAKLIPAKRACYIKAGLASAEAAHASVSAAASSGFSVDDALLTAASAIDAAQKARDVQQKNLNQAAEELGKMSELYNMFEEDTDDDEENEFEMMFRALSVGEIEEVLGITKNTKTTKEDLHDIFGDPSRMAALRAAYAQAAAAAGPEALPPAETAAPKPTPPAETAAPEPTMAPAASSSTPASTLPIDKIIVGLTVDELKEVLENPRTTRLSKSEVIKEVGKAGGDTVCALYTAYNDK
jgi:hypothetical protein